MPTRKPNKKAIETLRKAMRRTTGRKKKKPKFKRFNKSTTKDV